jgi:hypothetical protein
MSSDLVMAPPYARSTMPGGLYISPHEPADATDHTAYVRVHLSCHACQRQRDADLQALDDSAVVP